MHGEFVTGTTGAYVTKVAQRGAVTAVSASSLTVRSEDGFSQTYAVGSGTVVRKDGAAAKATDLAVGDTVRVVGTKDGSTVTADRVGSGAFAEQGRPGPRGHRGGKHGPDGDADDAAPGAGAPGTPGAGAPDAGAPGATSPGAGAPGATSPEAPSTQGSVYSS